MATKKKTTTAKKETTFIALCIKGNYQGYVYSGDSANDAFENYKMESFNETGSEDDVVIIKVNYPKPTVTKEAQLKVNKEITF